MLKVPTEVGSSRLGLLGINFYTGWIDPKTSGPRFYHCLACSWICFHLNSGYMYDVGSNEMNMIIYELGLIRAIGENKSDHPLFLPFRFRFISDNYTDWFIL